MGNIPAVARKKKEKMHISSLERRDMKTAYLMLAPCFILLCVFSLYPLVSAIVRSLYDWTFYTESKFIGLTNYITIIQSRIFGQTVLNALRFALFSVPLGVMIPFLFAALLRNASDSLHGFVKSATYVPGIMSGAVASTIIVMLISYKNGLINQLLMALGYKRVAFTSSEFWAYFWIIFVGVWQGLGSGTILYYAGIMGIPQDYYDAASLDGANAFQKLLYVTIPQMKNLFILQIINGVAGSLQMFEMPNFITAGGPRNSTMTPVLYLYNLYRDTTKTMGYTISAAVILLIIIAIINMFVFKLIRSEKLMEG